MSQQVLDPPSNRLSCGSGQFVEFGINCRIEPDASLFDLVLSFVLHGLDYAEKGLRLQLNCATMRGVRGRKSFTKEDNPRGK